MTLQFVDDVQGDWRAAIARNKEIRTLAPEYDSAILGAAQNKTGCDVLLYSSDALHDLLREEIEDPDTLEDAELDDRCTEWTSSLASAGDEGEGDPLVVDGPFDRDFADEQEGCFRFYIIGDEYWRGESVE